MIHWHFFGQKYEQNSSFCDWWQFGDGWGSVVGEFDGLKPSFWKKIAYGEGAKKSKKN